MFLSGLNPKEFLSNHKEWHALVEGFCDVFMPFVKRYEPSEDLRKDIQGEHHYYNAGRVIAFIAVVWFWIGVYKVVF